VLELERTSILFIQKKNVHRGTKSPSKTNQHKIQKKKKRKRKDDEPQALHKDLTPLGPFLHSGEFWAPQLVQDLTAAGSEWVALAVEVTAVPVVVEEPSGSSWEDRGRLRNRLSIKEDDLGSC
jgi:hypothetical protein